ncbi:WD repeat-containing protein 93 isoform X2 [Oryzias latipes]|uniref:WD repeat-containing protein 93 isoform X2 n=1 Tax=Oryzias latipes TaxID=8090 RepID=UPI000CE1935F|nr:WD repeat-containing protein 93 isoform X2 [Oryzias latipes]
MQFYRSAGQKSGEMAAACNPEECTVPTVELESVTQSPESTNCIACTEDGRYLSLGHCRGLSVWCASSFVRVAEWLQDQLEITFLQMTRMAKMTYLLGSVDDMGVARLFIFHCDDIHLLSVINAMEDINHRSICSTFALYGSGHFGAASISCNGASWLEVYQLPVAVWLAELETVSAREQDPNVTESVDVKWSSVEVLIKITPPHLPAGNSQGGALGADLLKHCLVVDEIRSSSCLDADAGTTDTSRSPRLNDISFRWCTHHFLLSCDPFSGQPLQSELPVAVAVWWSGSHNLLQYSLQKVSIKKAEAAPTPDSLWPNANRIICSAVSRRTRYIALGLDDALVCVWDRRTGAPLSIISLPKYSSLLRMEYLDCWPELLHPSQTPAAEVVHLLVMSKGGELYMIRAERGTHTCTTQLSERPNDSRDLPSVTISMPFLPGILLIIQRNGKMFLQDVINKTAVCFLTPPTPYQFSSACNPVFVLDPQLQALFIRGDLENNGSHSLKEAIQSRLFVFRFGQCCIIEQRIVSHPASSQRQNAESHGTPEEACSLYLQQRLLSLDERNKALEQTFERLHKTAQMIEQRQQNYNKLRKKK